MLLANPQKKVEVDEPTMQVIVIHIILQKGKTREGERLNW